MDGFKQLKTTANNDPIVRDRNGTKHTAPCPKPQFVRILGITAIPVLDFHTMRIFEWSDRIFAGKPT